MSLLDVFRADAENLINEGGSNVTYTKIDKTYDDDGSINGNTETEYTIIANIHPNNTDEMKMDNKLGQLVFGYAQIFFKYQYVINKTTTLNPNNDDIVTLLGTKYMIKQLKPWWSNGGVAYYEGQLVREDLD